MNLLELLFLCVSVNQVFAGSSSFVLLTSVLDETTLLPTTKGPPCANCSDIFIGKSVASNVLIDCDSGNFSLWLISIRYTSEDSYGHCVDFNYDYLNSPNILDSILQVQASDGVDRYQWSRPEQTTAHPIPDCVTCYELFINKPKTTRDCNSYGKIIWDIWYNISDSTLGGYCVDFESVDFNRISPQIMSISASSIGISSSATGALGYNWSRGGGLTRVTEVLAFCVRCFDVIHYGTRLSSFDCNSGSDMKIKVEYINERGEQDSGYCAGFITMSASDLTNFTQISWYDRNDNYDWVKPQDGISTTTLNPETQPISTANPCITCQQLFNEKTLITPHCDSNGQTLWDIWYNTSDAATFGGFCVDFWNTDLNLVSGDYVTYVRASNGSSTYEWSKSEPEIKQVTETFPPCVNCQDVGFNGVVLSSFYCDPGNDIKNRVQYTNDLNEVLRGYCVGYFHGSFFDSLNIIQFIIYNRYDYGSWNKPQEEVTTISPSYSQCVQCHDVLVYESELSTEGCDSGNQQLWSFSIQFSYYYTFGYCVNFFPEAFYFWHLSDNIQYAQANDGVENYYWTNTQSTTTDNIVENQPHCLSCNDLFFYNQDISTFCYPESQTKWDIWYNTSDAATYGGFCVDFWDVDLNSVSGDSITFVRAFDGSSTYEWSKSDPEIKQVTETFPPCVSCSDVAYSGASFSSFDCDPGNELKVRASYTDILGDNHLGYCVGMDFYDFTSANITNVALYNRLDKYFMQDNQSET